MNQLPNHLEHMFLKSVNSFGNFGTLVRYQAQCLHFRTNEHLFKSTQKMHREYESNESGLCTAKKTETLK